MASRFSNCLYLSVKTTDISEVNSAASAKPSRCWGKQANDERHCSLRIEDSPQLAESFNINGCKNKLNDIIVTINEEMIRIVD